VHCNNIRILTIALQQYIVILVLQYWSYYNILIVLNKPHCYYLTVAYQLSNLTVEWLPNHDFNDSNASSVSAFIWFLLSVIVTFTPENRRSGSASIAGIERISNAITESAG